MNVYLTEVRPRAGSWPNTDLLRGALGDHSFIALLLQETLPTTAVAEIAENVASGKPEVVAVWGEQAEQLHDLIDQECLKVAEFGPITVWEEDQLSSFLWNLIVVYKGLNKDIDTVDLRIVMISADDGLRIQLLVELESFSADVSIHDVEPD